MHISPERQPQNITIDHKLYAKIRLIVLGLILFSLIVTAAFVIISKLNAAATNPDDIIAADSFAAAQSGNMHYQNFVLNIGDFIIFNSVEGQLNLATDNGKNSIDLLNMVGSNFAFGSEQLLFTEGNSGGNLYKVNLDGSNQVRIGDASLKYLIFHKDKLYAIEVENGRAISLQMDGTGRTILADIQANALSLAGDKLFITGAVDEYGLTMIDLITKEQTILLTRRISSLNISGDWLYFSDPADGYRLTAYSLQQKQGWQISDFGIEKPFIVSGRYLYYIDARSQNRLYRLAADGRISLNGQNPELIVDDAVGSFIITGGYIYYQRPDSGRIYRIAAAGGPSVRIT